MFPVSRGDRLLCEEELREAEQTRQPRSVQRGGRAGPENPRQVGFLDGLGSKRLSLGSKRLSLGCGPLESSFLTLKHHLMVDFLQKLGFAILTFD